jgi:hypothetical protein
LNSLHVMRAKNGWVVKRHPEDKEAVIIERKTEALEIARRLTESTPETTVLLYKEVGQPPETVHFRRRKRRLFELYGQLRNPPNAS